MLKQAFVASVHRTIAIKDGKSLKTKPITVHALEEIEVVSPAFKLPDTATFPNILAESSFLIRNGRKEFSSLFGKSGWVGLRAIAHVVGGENGTWSSGSYGSVQISVANWSERKVNSSQVAVSCLLPAQFLSVRFTR